jgi:K(+)-stimulated pyrophosphate-energized sodium pump
MESLIYAVPAAGLLGLLFTYMKAQWIRRQAPGDENMERIAGLIARGAMSFLRSEYRIIGAFAILTAIVLGISASAKADSSPLIVLSFVSGAFLSALAGFNGMRIATRANVKTAQAAKTSLSKALDISFAGGAVMGMNVVSFSLIGLGVLYILFNSLYNTELASGSQMHKVLNILTGFSLGAETVALFARVGGGIFTKAADVGADLVGKVEAGIPEDDPRNPAVIADNVGDNVGDVAGMGADLFGSFVSTIVATMVLGADLMITPTSGAIQTAGVLLPLLLSAIGLIFSIAGTYFVKVKEGGNPQNALNMGNISAMVLTATASFFVIKALLPATFTVDGITYTSLSVFWSVIIGLVVGGLISVVTEYYCSMGRPPVNRIVVQSGTGAATNVIAGLSVGMISTALPIIILAGGIVFSYDMAGLYGVAMAATGMMATTGMQLAIDAFGPIADNAGGIAEMSGLDKSVRQNTDVLDAVGNTTAAIGKGFAIASAALTSLALFAAYRNASGLEGIDISDAKVLGGLLIGSMIPYLFSALAIRAVGSAANSMVEEVRRQFKEITGLLEGRPGVEPDYEKCIAISTNAAIRHMIAPGLIALLIPVFVALVAGPAVLGGLLVGVTASGVMMAIFQSNAGGAWDNAKKSFEKGVDIKGKIYYKGSDPHKASVVGDTVGDPFKDTSGPSMNILIKLMSIVALVFASLVR